MNQVLGVGVDIEMVARFAGLQRTENKIFLNKVFTKNELDFCFTKKNPATHLAVRFAAKEAVFKALTMSGVKKVPMNKLEIIRRPDGSPDVLLKIKKVPRLKIMVSLSHTKDQAIAVAMINSL